MRTFVCCICGFVYEEARGIPGAGIGAGTWWEELPKQWVCPLCGAYKSMFRERNSEVQQAASAEEIATSMELALEAMKKSMTCSKLALSCEKGRMIKEAAGFERLAEAFRRQAERVYRESGQMLYRSGAAKDFLEGLRQEEVPQEVVEELLGSIDFKLEDSAIRMIAKDIA